MKALTDLWTGDADGKSDRLVLTGLLGSIRWWFEVLVRGLGGRPCDPSNTKCQDRNHCVVCELFGCTGWARKFRFLVLAGEDGDAVKVDPCQKGQRFRFRFTALRDVAPEEWKLLDLSLRLIVDFGAIGGKTVLKPSDDASRARQPHHRDYGLIEIEQRPSIPRASRDQLESYIGPRRADRTWRSPSDHGFSWASLQYFWCVNGRYLARQSNSQSTFNRVIGRPEPKNRASQKDSWWAGRRPDRQRGQEAESKKVFSFKNPPRTFGFANPGTVDLAEITRRLKQAWPDLRDDEVVAGETLLDRLFGEEAPAP